MATAADQPPGEIYTHGYGEAGRRFMHQRTAVVDAAFLLPHLRPGMRLLDFGCGPGSITVGLAHQLMPGEVVGVDLAPVQIAASRALAAEEGTTNARFAVGSIYALPFPDASFDAAFARSVLEHLADPVAALREVRRVLMPGGVIGLRDGDWGGLVIAPPNPLVEEGYALYARHWALNGGNPNRGREHRALLREAGFGRIAASAGAEAEGTPAAMQHWTTVARAGLARPEFTAQVIARGWADRERLSQIDAAFQAWGKHPDAFAAVLLCDAVAWAD
jgi:SAM-dependent methyltransferase